MPRTLRTLTAAGTLALCACATPRRTLERDVKNDRPDLAAELARKTPTIDGEKTLDLALNCAAGLGRPKVIAELIARGADANSGRELTPLMTAAWRGHATSVEALLARGAEPNRATRKYRRTALMYAARFGNEDTVRALLAGGADARLLDWRGRDAAYYARDSAHYGLISLLKTAPAPSDPGVVTPR